MSDDSARLAWESWRIAHAPSFDARLAVRVARVDPLPHQVAAVYDAMLPRRPLRFLLADDPGAGKTIMAGLLITERRARATLSRCLVVAPGSLVDQWRDELFTKFDLRFALADRDDLRDPTWFDAHPLAIVRLDQCARDAKLVTRVASIAWDLVVFDEAHRLSSSWNGKRHDPTQRRRFASAVAASARDVLLMTATPHNGTEENFQAFLQILDADRFEGKYRPGVHTPRIEDILRRRLKEDLVRFDGSALFPPRRAVTARFALSPEEQRLYESVTAYVKAEFTRAEAQGGARGRTVGFALTILQRRLASSPRAIHRSLLARRDKLSSRLSALRSYTPDDEGEAPTDDELESALDLPGADTEREESLLVEGASAARTAAELGDEVRRLDELEAMARLVLNARVDRKRERVAELLNSREMVDARGRRRKLVVFTEHCDTLDYVIDFLATLRGRPECVVSIDGSMDRAKRLAAQNAFRDDEGVEFLVATDAAGEGINLQCASLVLNWDLPWSPARLEQRFGRVHRIGQTEPCQLWNLVAEGTRETAVFDALCRRLDDESRALRGQVFDVLGAAFDERPLREFLLDAVVHGGDAARVSGEVDRQLTQALTRQEAFSRRTGSLVDARERDTRAARDALDRAAALGIGRAAVEPWILAAMHSLGAKTFPRESGRWKANLVPAAWRSRAPEMPTRLASISVDPSLGASEETVTLTAAHPWTRALADAVIARASDSVSVAIDAHDASTKPWWLVALSQRLRDGDGTVLDERAWWAAVDGDGAVSFVEGPAHLDLSEADDEARSLASSDAPEGLVRRVEDAIVAPWRAEVQRSHRALVDAAQREVKARLMAERLEAQREAANARERGPRWAAAAAEASKREKALQSRILERFTQNERRREVVADPIEVGAVVRVVPAGALGRASWESLMHAKAVEAVIAVERLQGHEVIDARPRRAGWDLEGRYPDGRWRAWVVRAIAPDATTVTLRRSEAIALANAPETVSLALVEVDGDEVGVPVEVRGVVRDVAPFEASAVTRVCS